MADKIDKKILDLFNIEHKIGHGSYGVVWKAIDKYNRIFALKKCFDSFRNVIDAQRIYREVNYLNALKGHDNIIEVNEVFNSDNGDDMYLLFNYMPTDLYVLIRSNILEDIHIQCITYQLMTALKYVHSAGLIHRDLKPSNILLNIRCQVKLCDFGLCRSIVSAKNDGKMMTDYVATRYYRPPEVLLCSTRYCEKMDIWAAACIIGEMICARPLLPGHSTMNQIERIVQLIGMPTDEDLRDIVSPFSELMLSSISNFERVSLSSLLQREENTDALKLMQGMLRFNPTERYSAELALSHRYLSSFHNPRIEKSFVGKINLELDDDTRFPVSTYREKLECLITR